MVRGRCGHHRNLTAVPSATLVLLLRPASVGFLLADLAGAPSAPSLDLRLSWPRGHCLTMPRWSLPGAGILPLNPNPHCLCALLWYLLLISSLSLSFELVTDRMFGLCVCSSEAFNSFADAVMLCAVLCSLFCANGLEFVQNFRVLVQFKLTEPCMHYN